MLKIFAPAALVASLLAFSPSVASAAAAPGFAARPAADAGIVNVRSRDRVRRRHIRRRSFNRGYRAGSRHSRAPRGWHRHNRRPWDWRTRGCVIVGPLWFCP